MDDADRAAIEDERATDRIMRNRAAQRPNYTRSEDCLECGDTLIPVRQEFGLCISCAQAKELRERNIAA